MHTSKMTYLAAKVYGTFLEYSQSVDYGAIAFDLSNQRQHEKKRNDLST